jgi:Icc protein
MRVLHLSDPHIPRRTGPDEDGVDARAVLAGLLHDCRHVPDVDLVVVSGDVADDGSVEGYTDALGPIGSYARERGAAQVYCPGNHDARPEFSSVLGTGHLDLSGQDVGRLASEASAERAAVSEVGGCRVISLDSLVPGEVYGQVSRAQLTWLAEVLAEPVPAGSIVVLHHPPIGLDLPLHRQVGLQNSPELAEVLEGSDVHAVLCGHFHVQITGHLGRVPVWIGPGIITRIDLTAPPGLERAVLGAAATVVDLGGPYSPMFHVLHARDPQAGRPVYLVDAMSGVDVASEEGVAKPQDA